MISKTTGIYCEQPSCHSDNATIKFNGSNYCSEHAFYKQTGRFLQLEKIDEEETGWKWESKDDIKLY